MIYLVLGWLSGLAGYFVPPTTELLVGGFVTAVILRVLLGCMRPVLLWAAGAGAGGLWAMGYGAFHGPLEIPAYLPPQTMTVKVVSLPAQVNQPKPRISVLAEVVQAPEQFPQWQGAVLRLGAYGQQAQGWSPRPGERWQVLLKVRPVHGWVNFYGFDYEAWAFQKGIQANATVRQVIAYRGRSFSGQQLRSIFARQVARHWETSPFAGIYDALTFGARERITPEQWQLFQQTGTVHLMAISGLHMGMVAAVGFALFFWLWRWAKGLHSLISRPHFAALGMVLLASGYLLLCGMAVPALRAWLMVVLVAVLLLLRRNWHPWALLALAAFLITLLHPPSVLSPGFWLSFIAVALIFVTLMHPLFKTWGHIRQFLILQGVLTLGLLPVVGFFFQQSAGGASLINLLLVPLLPMVLLLLALASGLFQFWPDAGGFLIQGLDLFWQWMTQAMVWLSQHFQPLEMHWPLVAVLFWLLGILLLMTGGALRWAGGVLGLCLISFWILQPRPVPDGAALITLLDVGQGQAVVIETRNHVLVYDAGPKWGRLDAGGVVVSHLRGKGWHAVDRLVLSHHDWDHIGGAATVLKHLPVKRLDAGQPQFHKGVYECLPQSWVWDGVFFTYLPRPPAKRFRRDNERSCILRVRTGEHAFLIAGDLSKRGERWLLTHVPKARMRADLLVANHHGSRTSNSTDWLEAIQPRQIAVSAGFANPFYHPAASVKARWLAQHVDVHCTGCEGALRYLLSQQGVGRLQGARTVKKAFFRHFCRQKKTD